MSTAASEIFEALARKKGAKVVALVAKTPTSELSAFAPRLALLAMEASISAPDSIGVSNVPIYIYLEHS